MDSFARALADYFVFLEINNHFDLINMDTQRHIWNERTALLMFSFNNDCDMSIQHGKDGQRNINTSTVWLENSMKKIFFAYCPSHTKI